MAEWTPYSKEQQLSRGQRRYRRKIASPKQWQAIVAAKRGPCRVCAQPPSDWLQYHHIVSREDHGDDLADNIVPLCGTCHDKITRRDPESARLLLSNITDAEYAYVIQRGGEDYFVRAYGLEYAP